MKKVNHLLCVHLSTHKSTKMMVGRTVRLHISFLDFNILKNETENRLLGWKYSFSFEAASNEKSNSVFLISYTLLFFFMRAHTLFPLIWNLGLKVRLLFQ